MRYCSWDVREMAGDWSWSEMTDSRDTSSLLFRSPPSASPLSGSLCLSVQLGSGLVTLFTEEEALRSVICSQTISQFEQLEKLFQLDPSIYPGRLVSSKSESKDLPGPKISIRSPSDTSEVHIDPLKDGSIDVEAFGKIFRRWDQEEKNF